MDCTHQTSLSIGFSRQEFWGGLPFPPPGNFPDPRIIPMSPALAVRFFTTEPAGKLKIINMPLNLYEFQMLLYILKMIKYSDVVENCLCGWVNVMVKGSHFKECKWGNLKHISAEARRTCWWVGTVGLKKNTRSHWSLVDLELEPNKVLYNKFLF